MTANFAAKAGCLVLSFLFAISLTSKAQPTANFTGAPLAGCAPLVVNFIDQSTGSPTQWRWDLDNGTISFLQNPSVTYFNPGQYNIKLVVQNAAGADSIIKNQFITVYAQPAVAFTASATTGCFPLHVQFTDQSGAGAGSIVSWIWDFGDGFGDNVQNPMHIYTAAGNYNVSLQAKNSFGCVASLTRAQYIQISSGVHADFSNSNPNTCSPPVNINFTNLSTGTGVLNFKWNFGDGNTSTAQNPSHTYNSAGTYTVQLITISSGGCTDTITKINAITIGNVNAAFTSADSVCESSPILFTNTSVPAPASVIWDFGDATTSASLNPSKVYTAAGTYIVKMVANFGACTDSAFKTITVLPKPVSNFNAGPLSSCKAPLTVNFTDLSTNAVSYLWNFGDGNTSTLQNPAHTYTTTGSFTVTLTVTSALGCVDAVTNTAYINIQAPVASINNLPHLGCAPLTHTFTAAVNSVDPVVSYLWNFGDGNTSTLASPTHIFAAGSYNIQLIITTSGGCSDTVDVPNGIIASTKPVANFSANPLTACAKIPISFTDLSTGTVTQWFWNFGDGSTSTQQNPTHLYNDTGYFDVELIVMNGGCPDTIRFLNYIHILPPIASFGHNFICGSKAILFIDQSLGANQWNWDFGDGNTSTQQYPTHTYADSGIYIITLTVVNLASGCDHSTTHTVHLVDEKARFFASDTVICKGTGINFTSYPNNAANISSFDWTFGDGSTATGINPSHTYLQSGTYDVRLIITDVNGCKDTLLKPQYIRVDGPTADFSSTVPGSCLNSAVIFTDNSLSDGTHPVQTWIWAYGDGTIDTLTAGPFQHTYVTPGNYTVSLKVIDSKGCADSIVKPSFFTISKPKADFFADTLTCANNTVQFTNISSGPNLNFLWDFGDGSTDNNANPVHAYTSDGVYTIKLVVTDLYGCTDSITKINYITVSTVRAGFTMSDSASTCPPLVVQFTNTSLNSTSASWDFGDGTFAQGQTPSHFYSYPGTYIVKLTVTGAGTCTDVMQKQIIVRGPKGSFNYNPFVGCNPLQINFTATTQDRVSFIWDYNDGSILSTSDSVVSHTYTVPGTYLPRMILIDSGGCQVPILGLDTIHVNGVMANFGIDKQLACDAGSFNFSDSTISTDAIATYAWNFGDGNNSNVQHPTHFYAAPGIYFPQLIVTSQSGCVDTVTSIAPVKIVSSPQAGLVKSPNGCTPLTVTFNGNLLLADTSAISWSWNFGNGNTSSLQNPAAQVYTSPGLYNIQLIASNSSGCMDTVTTTVDAFMVPTVTAGVDTMICKGIGVNITAAGANSYTWTPSAGLSCSNCSSPVATPDSVMNYIVTGTTLQGCIGHDTIQVKVKYPFVMNASNSDTLCLGGSTQLFAVGAYSYIWSPSTGLSSTTSASPTARPTTTTTYMVIGTDDHNCFKDTSYVPVIVYPVPTVNAGADQTINVGQTTDLVPVISADVNQVIWSPTGSIFRNIYPGITVKPRETTEYTVEVRNQGGCKSRDKVTVFVICNGANVFIPNTFSPNGDGANDVFYPRGTGLFSIKALRVYNRWGELVFEGNNFNANDAGKGWNGTFKGMKLTPDVYVYTMDIVCDNSTIMTFKGNVALIQ